MLEASYDVVIDYVTFPREAAWLSQKLSGKGKYTRIVYVVLLVDPATIQFRDGLRPADERMGERSLILLKEFENDPGLSAKHKLYTERYGVEQMPEIVREIVENDKYRWV